LPVSSIGGWTEGKEGADTAKDKRLDMVAAPQEEMT
jgi:hypothetical protein